MRRLMGLAAVAVVTGALTSCFQGGSVGIDFKDAENCNMNPKVAREWPSPDGRSRAIESRFDCPGWYALKVEVNDPKGAKTVALDDRPVDQVRPAVWPELKVEWKSERELWITYPARQDTTCISRAGDVTVHCLDATVKNGIAEVRQP